MEQSGEYRIPATRDVVWEALNDPDVLARCIEGCQTMEKSGDDRFDARVKARVGPVRATFDVQLTLEDVVPPEHYTLAGNVKGGAAGFARGSARVDLEEVGEEETLLRYAVNGSVGGKLAQVGSRLIDGTARKMADDFFAAFHRELGGEETAASAAEPPASGEDTSPASAPAAARAYESGGKWMIWLVAFVALLLALLFAF